MTPQDHNLWIDMITARYVTAIEADDFEQQNAIWELAGTDEELIRSLNDVQDAMLEEQKERRVGTIKGAVASAMPSARIDAHKEGPVTVADVAEELGRTAGPKLKADGYAFVETLSGMTDALPANLGLSQFAAWAEQRFPGAPAGFWALFHKSSLKVERRRESQDTYQLAARRASKALPAPPPEEPQ